MHADEHESNFSVEIEYAADSVFIHPRGEIDLSTRDRLWSAIEPALGCPIVLDLAEMTFVDSSGIAILVRARRSQDDHGEPFALRNPSPTTIRLLTTIGLDGLLTPFVATAAEQTAGLTWPLRPEAVHYRRVDEQPHGCS